MDTVLEISKVDKAVGLMMESYKYFHRLYQSDERWSESLRVAYDKALEDFKTFFRTLTVEEMQETRAKYLIKKDEYIKFMANADGTFKKVARTK